MVGKHLLLKVLSDNTRIIFAELKHARVKDFVVQLLPLCNGLLIVGVDNSSFRSC
jgi:hypothetical protein